MRVRFLLICEGSSDTALVHHIQALLIDCGASEADGIAWYRGRRVKDKIRHGLQYHGGVDLLFVNRDADSAGAEARFAEIGKGIAAADYHGRWVGVVPVRMTEAWLLTDEAAIRRVAGRPRGTEPLDLPPPHGLEDVSNPKQMLRDVLLKAGAPGGARRRKRFASDFDAFRKQLAENLPVGGSLEQLDAWVRFRDDVTAAGVAGGRRYGRSSRNVPSIPRPPSA